MNKLLLLIFLFIGINSVQSQNITYFNYLDYSSEWRHYYTGWTGFGTVKYYSTYYFDGDTVINGQPYYLRFRKQLDTTTYMGGGFTVDSVTYGGGLMREDSLGRFLTYYNGQETVMEDFGSLHINGFFRPNDTACRISSIDTLYLGATPLRHYNRAFIGAYPQGIVEGVGLLASPCGQAIESVMFYVCYKKQNDEINFYPAIDCASFPSPGYRHYVGTAQISSPPDFHAYPTPTSNILNLNHSKQGLYAIELYDLYGRQVLQQQGLEGEETLDVSYLPAGVYWLQMKDAEGGRVVEKMVKL